MSKRDITTIKTLARTLTVTDYFDYRDYLRDLYERAKAAFRPYSYLRFAEDLGFSQINLLRLVIARQRLLSPKSAQTIVRTLELRKAARKYFLAMVNHVNARGGESRDHQFAKMVEAKQASVVSHRDKNQMAFFADWYHSVVSEMLRIPDLRKDPESLAAQVYPSLSADRIRESFALMESLGMIEIAPTGEARRAKDSPIVLPSDATAGHLAITKYHQEMIDAAKAAVAKVPHDEREFNAMTVTLSDAGFDRLRERIREVCAEVIAMDEAETKRERVFQLNMQLFALTKKRQRGVS